MIWDRAGAVWSEIAKNFKAVKSTGAAPNQSSFNADDRYVMSIATDRASITDWRPSGSMEEINKTLTAFAETAIRVLDVRVITRVGNRHIYTLEFKSQDEARKKMRETHPSAIPKKALFSIPADKAVPAFKVEMDDGELACSAQLYQREKKIEFTPPPDVAVMGVEKTDKAVYEVVLDLDFSTKKPIPAESFEAQSWVQGWSKSVTRDADAFLSLVEGSV